MNQGPALCNFSLSFISYLFHNPAFSCQIKPTKKDIKMNLFPMRQQFVILFSLVMFGISVP